MTLSHGEDEENHTLPYGMPVVDTRVATLLQVMREDLVRILAERDLFRHQLDERPTREEYIALVEACEVWSARAKKAEVVLEAVRMVVK